MVKVATWRRILRHFITIILAITVLGPISMSYAADSAHKGKAKHQQKRLKINPLTEYENVWTANAETNVYQNSAFENITLGYSTTNGWDYGLSLLNTQFLGGNNQFQGDTFFSITKTFDINDTFSIVVGSQNGLAIVNAHPQRWYNFDFLDSRYDATSWLSLHGGPYLANSAITGTSRQIALLMGTEITLMKNKLSLQMDYISGHDALSGATVNLLFNITPRSQIYMGLYVPEQNSGNEYAGIIGFNISTHNL
jgi:hypothetical protein